MITKSIIPPNFVNDNRTRRCDTMAQDVLCEVNNCKFLANGNKCSADAIYVVSHKGKQASTTEETDCKLSIRSINFKGNQIVVALLLIIVLIINLIFIHCF